MSVIETLTLKKKAFIFCKPHPLFPCPTSTPHPTLEWKGPPFHLVTHPWDRGEAHIPEEPRPVPQVPCVGNGTWSDPEAQNRLLRGPPGHPDQVSIWKPPCLRTSPHP